VEARATLHVTPQLPALQRCSVAVPHNVLVDSVNSVVAAVGSGPHSLLAAAAAQRIGDRLGVPASVLTGYRTRDEWGQANRALLDIAAGGIDLPMRAVATQHPPGLVETLAAGTLVVIGAPGGSWFQRQLFGAGARLRAAAPGGVLIVRNDVTRVYQVMTAPHAIGPAMRVRDALELTSEPIVLVAEHGRLTGMVRRSRLAEAEPHFPVGEIAEAPIGLDAAEPIDQVRLVLDEHGGGPVGVVDRNGLLIGAVSAKHLSASSPRAAELAS
jgi:CBS domain-containing protein